MSVSAWRTADRPAVDFGTGAEQIARAAAYQISQSLEVQCELQETIWAQRDQDWAALMGKSYFPTTITRVPNSSIYTGARPSLVESKFDLWPAITVRCGPRTASSDPEQGDQFDSHDIELIIEVLAMTGPYPEVIQDRDPDDEIDRQYQRLTDAVIACINLDRTLGETVLPLKRPPRVIPSLPFVRKEDQGAGEYLLFQGAELTYSVTKLFF